MGWASGAHWKFPADFSELWGQGKCLRDEERE